MVSHKQKLRSEKAKIKLKGAKLPKGLNVTKTEFKVRKIMIREQLKDPHSLDGQKQFNLKEVLSRLKHHSSGYRSEALRHLREAIPTGQVCITGYMSELLQGVSAICLDVDKETRRDSFKALNCLLATLSVDEVRPFFHIISSYLRCAMTHIQPAIQEDAILMLDVLLQYVPTLVAANSAKIFQNFLEMISRARSDGDRAARTLTVRLGSQQTTVKWRTKVLERLQQMLTTLVDQQQKRINGNSAATAEMGMQSVTHIFNPKAPQYFSLKWSYSKNSTYDYASVFGRSVGDVANSATSTLEIDESQSLRSYVQHLMPLLIETWLEVRPQDQNGQIVLSKDAAQTLKVVLEVIEKLWHMVDLCEKIIKNDELSKWFQSQYADPFAANFLSVGFPFQRADQIELSSKRKRKTKSTKENITTDDQLCLAQNIYLSYLTCCFYSKRRPLQQQSKKISALLQYLIQIVSNLSLYPLQSYRPLTLALQIFLVKNGAILLDIHPAPMRQLLNTTINAFLQSEFPNKDGAATRVLTLLCEIVQLPEMKNHFGEAEFMCFLEFLPQLLLKSTINLATLTVMSNLGKQRNVKFLNALDKRIENVIDNIQKIQVSGAINAFEGKKHIMNLFYWSKKEFSTEYKIKLEQKIETCITDKRMICYFKCILT